MTGSTTFFRSLRQYRSSSIPIMTRRKRLTPVCIHSGEGLGILIEEETANSLQESAQAMKAAVADAAPSSSATTASSPSKPSTTGSKEGGEKEKKEDKPKLRKEDVVED